MKKQTTSKKSSFVPQYRRIYDDLKEKIQGGTYPEGTQLPAERELCLEYGVERITVRRSLEMLVQDGLVEKRPGIGSFVRSATPEAEPASQRSAGSSMLLYVMHRNSNDIRSNPSAFNSMLFFAAEHACKEMGYMLSFAAVSADDDFPALIRQNNAAGIFLVSKLPDGFYDSIMESGLPAICLNHRDDRFLSVLPDNTDGAFDGVSQLIQLGHRRIGYIDGSPEFFNARERFDGYRKALLYTGLPFDPTLVRPGNWTYESGTRCMEELLALPDPPTAVFAASDMMAIGAMEAIRRAGLSVPGDISVIGFDGIDACTLCSPQLSSIAISAKQMAQVACEQLDMRIRNGFAEHCCYTIRLKTKLAGRSSLSSAP